MITGATICASRSWASKAIIAVERPKTEKVIPKAIFLTGADPGGIIFIVVSYFVLYFGHRASRIRTPAAEIMLYGWRASSSVSDPGVLLRDGIGVRALAAHAGVSRLMLRDWAAAACSTHFFGYVHRSGVPRR